MSDLYTEILKSEQMSKSIDDFITEIVEDPTVRDNFLEEFVDEVIDSMDSKDIVRAYAQKLLDDLYYQCEENKEELIVEECANYFPYVLQRFGVNVDEDT